MTTRNTISDEVQALRARADLYRKLAASLFDKRTARELQQYALELEVETAELAARLEDRLAGGEKRPRSEELRAAS